MQPVSYESGRTELYIVLTVMLVLLIFGIGATVIFLRTWRKERGRRK